MSDSTTVYPCGCVNCVDPDWSILRSVKKCVEHLRHAGRTGLGHYEEMGCIKDGQPIPTNHIKELTESLEMINRPLLTPEPDARMLIEIGCGTGVYLPLLQCLGYAYLGIEPDAEAAEFVRRIYNALIVCNRFEDCFGLGTYHAILAAHVFEHFQDSPAMLKKVFQHLCPGGRLILVLPDDSDPVNPDHLWFYTEQTLRWTLERVGFVDVQAITRKIVEREKFIYASAAHP